MMKVRLLTLYIICLTCNLLTAQTVQWSVKPTYSSLEEYVGKLYKYRENGKVGLVDISGKVLVEAKYDSITRFTDYHALAFDFQNSNLLLRGIINQNDLRLTDISDDYYLSKDLLFFSEGKLIVSNRNREFGYMLTDGTLLTECKYEKAFPFYHKRALTHEKDKKGNIKVIYIDENGEDYVTSLQREGFLFRPDCTSFNEDGVALVRYQKGKNGMKYAEMTVNGKKIREFNNRDSATNRYVKRKLDFVETSDLLPVPVKSTILTMKDKHGLLGFCMEGNDKFCIPAQFSEAYPFKDGYARVKKGGYYGILKLVPDVLFEGSFLQNKIEVINGRADSLKYNFKLPQQLHKANWRMEIEDSFGIVKTVLNNNNASGKIQIAFKSNLNKAKEQNYKILLYADELLLWEDNEKVTFNYLYSNIIEVEIPVVDDINDKHTCDKNGYYNVNESGELNIYTQIKNKSSEDIKVQVIIGAKYRNTSENLSVKPDHLGEITIKANTTKVFRASVENITKEGELEIYVKTSNKGEKRINIIKVKPLI